MAPKKTRFMSYLFEKVKIDGFIVRKSTDLCLFRSKKYRFMSVSFEKVHFYVFFVKKGQIYVFFVNKSTDLCWGLPQRALQKTFLVVRKTVRFFFFFFLQPTEA